MAFVGHDSSVDSTRAGASRSLPLHFALVVVAAIMLWTSACGSSGPSTPEPYTEQAVIAAFRKAGIEVPVVLRSGESCHPDRWPVSPSTESTKAATLYACGRLEEAGIDTENLPEAVLLVGAFTPTPNYLISVYRGPPSRSFYVLLVENVVQAPAKGSRERAAPWQRRRGRGHDAVRARRHRAGFREPEAVSLGHASGEA